VPHEPTPEWFAARVPKEWFADAPRVLSDSEEVLVIGRLSEVDGGDTEAAREAARHVRISQFRQQSRELRMAIAADAERLFHRRVSWGAECGGRTELFTTASSPVMTRLRLPERQVLDTLIGAGVARSRSDALAWCVRLVGRHQGDWIDSLREALRQVEEVRAKGPD
jgi:hypothetical protein